MLISHADQDHAGGREAMVAAMPIHRALGGEPVTANVGAGRRGVSGDQWGQSEDRRCALAVPGDRY